MHIPNKCRDTNNYPNNAFLQGGCLCVSTFENLVWLKANRFNRFFAEAKTVSRFAGLKLYFLPSRASKYPPSPECCIFPISMSEISSRNLTKPALELLSQNRSPAGLKNAPKSSLQLLQKRLSALRICWASLSNAGPLKSFASILLRIKSSSLSVSRNFAVFLTRRRSDSDAPKRGKNATIQGSSLKKTNPKVCKPARIQRPNGIFRRIWSIGDSACSRAMWLSYRPSQTASCNLYPPSWGSPLACVLRFASKETMGIHSRTQEASGSFGCVEITSSAVSAGAEDTSDFGQFLASLEEKGDSVLPIKQYSSCLDADQCFMAQPYRMPIYACERICYSRN